MDSQTDKTDRKKGRQTERKKETDTDNCIQMNTVNACKYTLIKKERRKMNSGGIVANPR